MIFSVVGNLSSEWWQWLLYHLQLTGSSENGHLSKKIHIQVLVSSPPSKSTQLSTIFDNKLFQIVVKNKIYKIFEVCYLTLCGMYFILFFEKYYFFSLFLRGFCTACLDSFQGNFAQFKESISKMIIHIFLEVILIQAHTSPLGNREERSVINDLVK